MPPTTEKRLRAHARRNRDTILATAHVVVREQGANASLEEISRRAGVGSATLYRHFPTRAYLLELVLRDRVESLVTQAETLLADPAPGEALADWLRIVIDLTATNPGLATAMTYRTSEAGLGEPCRDLVRAAAEKLITRAKQAGACNPDVQVDDLLDLVHAIATATEHHPARADALMLLAVKGITTPLPPLPED
ncbi:TetR/AcrR family transcriptional regulator [Actinokineospora inagensis]|uniref:TetR/AcrR family transcriptional regulator n=1 Tax=Actinokineospora inagensis TaxID=103730 RepID=UPI00040ED0ED|nr:TetR/AcrR family transcriptional regulator [Actinokineospora inagensis]